MIQKANHISLSSGAAGGGAGGRGGGVNGALEIDDAFSVEEEDALDDASVVLTLAASPESAALQIRPR